MKRYIMMTLMMGLSACGGLKVGLDDDTLQSAECIINDSCDDNGGSTVGETDDSDDSDVEIIPIPADGYEESDDRTFIGTYSKLSHVSDYYDNHANYQKCEYDFPTNLRGYTHNQEDFIDFETNNGVLVWIARLFQDDTFDFTVAFQDSIGTREYVDCSCYIEPEYFDYYNDQIRCSCESESDDCVIYYEKMAD